MPLSSSSSSSSPQTTLSHVWKYFIRCHSFWHQSSLTYTVGIVFSTNSQPKQHDEQLAPVQSLLIFGLYPRRGWRFSDLVNSVGFGSYLTFPKVVQIILVLFCKALPSTDIIYFHNTSKMDMVWTSSRSYSSRFFSRYHSFFSIFMYSSSRAIMETFTYYTVYQLRTIGKEWESKTFVRSKWLMKDLVGYTC